MGGIIWAKFRVLSRDYPLSPRKSNRRSCQAKLLSASIAFLRLNCFAGLQLRQERHVYSWTVLLNSFQAPSGAVCSSVEPRTWHVPLLTELCRAAQAGRGNIRANTFTVLAIQPVWSFSRCAMRRSILRRASSDGCGAPARMPEKSAAGAQQRPTSQRPKRQSCRFNHPPRRQTFAAALSPLPAIPAPWPNLVSTWLFTDSTFKHIWSLNTPPHFAPGLRRDAWPDRLS